VALIGFPKSREPFFKGVYTQKKLPDWKRLWDDCIQEETREESKVGKQGDEEKEKLTLVSKTRKGKGKGSRKNDDGEESSSQSWTKGLSKIKCFMCQKYGHYASQCPKKKGQGKTQTSTSTKIQLGEFATTFEKELTLISCLFANTNSRSA
jgi:hypothetical protein